MDNQLKALFGSWVQAIGTFIAAVGSTPSPILTNEQLLELNLIGNAMQAVGNALMADSMEFVNLGKVGNELQSIGNLTVVSGILLSATERAREKFIIKGNLIQALGGFAATGDGFGKNDERAEAVYFVAHYLQGIGNSMQAIGASKKLRLEEFKSGESIEVSGSWIQTVGSVLVALEETKDWYVSKAKKVESQI